MTTFARVAFALLVGATFAAFFVAQRVKSAPPVVGGVRVVKFFSPNADGVREREEISFRLKGADDVTVDIVDADGDRVQRLADGLPAQAYRPVRVVWDGATDAGDRAPDGIYRVRLNLRRQGRSVTVQKVINLDTRAPNPVVRSVTPKVAAPGAGPVRVVIRGSSRRRAPRFEVWRTDLAPARRVAEFAGRRRLRAATWDGLRAGGRPLEPGTYLISARVEDRAGNVGSAPRVLPPRPGGVEGSPGLTVRRLAVQPPLAPVRAGAPARFFVDARGRSFRWRVRRVGGTRTVAQGSARAGTVRLAVRAPKGTSGAYLLEVRRGRYATRVPFAVQDAERAPLLVVLPAITWLGLDRVDDDGDGLPNTLESDPPVRYPRPFAGDGGLPAGFARSIGPLLAYLDRSRVRYDLTTDVALDGSRDPRATDRPGVLLAGDARWISRRLAARLRRFVLNGGNLATFGAQSLRRGVLVGPGRLSRPTQPSPVDALGERMRPLRRNGPPPTGLGVLIEEQSTGLLTGVDGELEGFTVLEESDPDESRPKLLVGVGQEVSEAEALEAGEAGTETRRPLPALTASRLGRGLVIRVGLPQWGDRLLRDPEVRQVTRNIADLLRGVRPRLRSSR